MIFYLTIIISLNLIFIFYHKQISQKINIYDVPDSFRKLHKSKTALTGGILLYLNVLAYSFFYFLTESISSYFFLNNFDFLIFLISCSLVFFVGMFDDKKNLSPNSKFFLLLIIITPSILVIDNLLIDKVRLSFLENEINLNNFSIFWTILCMLLFINAVNMFDGINLQTSTYFLFQALFLGIFTKFDPILFLFLISILIFSILNSKSKSFLGDSGSLLLAYIFACLFIILYNKNLKIYSDEIVLIMIIPGIELLRLFATRILQKKNPFKPDRNHLHHILLKKNSFFITSLIIQTLIILPTVISLLFGKTIIILIVTIILYFFILKKNY